MTANFDRGSAKIYQFPVRGRFAAPGQFGEANPATLMSAQVAKALGGSWYHEEAVQEAELSRKN